MSFIQQYRRIIEREKKAAMKWAIKRQLPKFNRRKELFKEALPLLSSFFLQCDDRLKEFVKTATDGGKNG